MSAARRTSAALSPAPVRARRGHGRVTLRQVASVAGVTAITVSRFLRAPEQVAGPTAERIRLALAESGYVPNKQAGLLASGRSSIVAALVPNLAHSIFAETLQGLSVGLEAHGLELLVAASNYDLAREEAQVSALLGWQPRALVITGRHHTRATMALLRQAEAGGCTVVEMWDLHARGRFSQVGFDHLDAGARMAAHLLTLGRRQLVYVDSAVAGDQRARARGDGFVAAAQAAGVPVRRITAPAGEPIGAGRQVLAGVTVGGARQAVAMANDHLACGLLLQAQAEGVAVPASMAVIGFGDFELASQLPPGLSTMAPPRRQIGALSAGLVLAGAPPVRRVVVECPLVVRGSTGA